MVVLANTIIIVFLIYTNNKIQQFFCQVLNYDQLKQVAIVLYQDPMGTEEPLDMQRYDAMRMAVLGVIKDNSYHLESSSICCLAF